jgi:GH24 family phage-related lysozyme (muramidase)
MRITITERQLNILVEQNEEYLVTSNVGSSELTTFISGDEELYLTTYDDAYYPPKEYVSSKYVNKKPGGTLTIGYGHTGKEAYEGNIITKEKAVELLKKDLTEAIGCVNRIVMSWTKDKKPGAKMDQCMYDSIVSLVFNSGCQNVRNSGWIQDVKFGKWEDAYTGIKTWNPPKQRKKDGTWVDNYKRREKEAELFYNCEY